MTFFSRFSNKDNNLNEYGVVPVMFHIECNSFGEHGTVMVTSRKRNIDRAVVSFFLKDVVELPPLTSKLLQEITAAAESQGYTLHHLISYAQVSPHINPGPATSQQDQSMLVKGPQMLYTDTPHLAQSLALAQAQAHRFHGSQYPKYPVRPGEYMGGGMPRVIMERNVPSDVGDAALAAASKMAKQEPHNFNMGSLNTKPFQPNPESAEIPAFLRKQNAELDETIKLLASTKNFWMLNDQMVVFQFGTLGLDRCKEISLKAKNLAREALSTDRTQEELQQDLDHLAEEYQNLVAV